MSTDVKWNGDSTGLINHDNLAFAEWCDDRSKDLQFELKFCKSNIADLQAWSCVDSQDPRFVSGDWHCMTKADDEAETTSRWTDFQALAKDNTAGTTGQTHSFLHFFFRF